MPVYFWKVAINYQLTLSTVSRAQSSKYTDFYHSFLLQWSKKALLDTVYLAGRVWLFHLKITGNVAILIDQSMVSEVGSFAVALHIPAPNTQAPLRRGEWLNVPVSKAEDAGMETSYFWALEGGIFISRSFF